MEEIFGPQYAQTAAQKLVDFVQDDRLEIVRGPNGFPIERARRIGRFEAEIERFDDEKKKRLRTLFKDLQLARRGLVKRADGYREVMEDGSEIPIRP